MTDKTAPSDPLQAETPDRIAEIRQRELLEALERIKDNLAQEPAYYRSREDFGDDGPDSTTGAVRILLDLVASLQSRLQQTEQSQDRLIVSWRSEAAIEDTEGEHFLNRCADELERATSPAADSSDSPARPAR